MRFPRQHKIFYGRWDVAPVAGVFFLMLLFLVLQSSLVSPPGVSVSLPEGGDTPGLQGPFVTVALDSSGQLFFEDQVIGREQLKVQLTEAVKKAGEPLTLMAQLDKWATVQALVWLEEVARSSGVKRVQLVTRPPMLLREAPGIGKK